MERLIQRIDTIEILQQKDVDLDEDELVNCLQETLKCTRAIMNTWPGVRFFLKKNSMLCSRLIEALYALNTLKSKKNEQAVIYILGLLAAISFLGENRADEFEITGLFKL